MISANSHPSPQTTPRVARLRRRARLCRQHESRHLLRERQQRQRLEFGRLRQAGQDHRGNRPRPWHPAGEPAKHGVHSASRQQYRVEAVCTSAGDGMSARRIISRLVFSSSWATNLIACRSMACRAATYNALNRRHHHRLPEERRAVPGLRRRQHGQRPQTQYRREPAERPEPASCSLP